ncbi:21301_t:CDS:2 [Gigaspora rosea]|nr:21301_t:CDS:2 [Gigaspora rosea]
MTDNTKFKLGLRYSYNLGCIVGSVLSNEKTKVNIYNDILRIINKIKEENRIAKTIALIPNNGTDTADSILQLQKQLIIDIAPQLGLFILFLRSDGAITEFQAQQSISKTQTNEKLIVKEPYLNINFSCSIFDQIGPVIHVQDPKHAKKIARNAIMSGAHLLTFGNSSA